MKTTNMIFRGVKADNPFPYTELQKYGKIAYLSSHYDGVMDKEKAKGIVNNILYKNIMEFVDLYEDMEQIRLEDYCAIIIPAMIDEVYLHRYKNKIRAYLDHGGVVLSFIQNFTGMIPGNKGYIASATPIKDREVYFTESDSSKLIFDGVREYDVNVRRGVKGFFNRGYFSLEHFAKEQLPEVIMQDNDGKCVAYIDRMTTEGIILAAASSDLIGYGLFDNTTARRIGPNILYWLEKELQKKDYHALREKMAFKKYEINEEVVFDYGSETADKGLKKAIITGGAAFHQKFFKNKDGKYSNMFNKRVYVADMEDFCFEDYDYVVIASGLNIRFLIPHKERIMNYLRNGGHIVSLGDSSDKYLPNIKWMNYPTNFWWWRIEGADMPLYALETTDGGKTLIKQPVNTREGLFSKIKVSVAKWHCHGAFLPPENADSILVNEMDEAIIYKDKSFPGNLYVMSLDPDYHFGQGFMPTTEPFFDALMSWIEEDIRGQEPNDAP